MADAGNTQHTFERGQRAYAGHKYAQYMTKGKTEHGTRLARAKAKRNQIKQKSKA